MFLDILDESFKIKCKTDNKSISGLPKDYWLRKGDNIGSVWYPVKLNDRNAFDKAVE